MEMSEFLNRHQQHQQTAEELDVQKAVVESLAADKAEQDERLFELGKENESLRHQITELNEKLAEIKASLEKVGDVLAKNSEETVSNKLSLIDRDPDLGDRYVGETRDHVLEVIREACERAEKEGQVRRAQVLEGVLVVNSPTGNLKKKRDELRKLFTENGNILSGAVINELEKMGISHKNGENYLLPEEIIKRNY